MTSIKNKFYVAYGRYKNRPKRVFGIQTHFVGIRYRFSKMSYIGSVLQYEVPMIITVLVMLWGKNYPFSVPEIFWNFVVGGGIL